MHIIGVMSAGVGAANAAATGAATKPDKAADDKVKAVEADTAPKPVVKPRRDRKVGPPTRFPLCYNVLTLCKASLTLAVWRCKPYVASAEREKHQNVRNHQLSPNLQTDRVPRREEE